MLRELRAFFGGEPEPPSQPDVQLATAVLLVEVMRSYEGLAPAERSCVREALAQCFELDEGACARLLARAERASRDAGDFFAFTWVVNARLARSEKLRLVERMWQVAYADGSAQAHEMHTISRLSGLLHLTHGEYIAAKLRAKEAAGLG